MSSAESLREFVTERLTAAAEEIVRVFEKTVVQFEEEIHRQRRLLEIVWKPEIRLHRTELPEQQVWDRDGDPGPDQEDPEGPLIKEEEEEERLVLKQETDPFMVTPAAEDRDQQLLPVCSNAAESQDQGGRAQPDSGPTRDMGTRPTDKKSFKCDICGKAFQYRSKLKTHQRNHTGEKPFSCCICRKTFRWSSCMLVHMRTHTGEKPYSCGTCGRRFNQKTKLMNHMRIHSDERPWSCEICGRSYKRKDYLKVHLRFHAGEKL